jgi:hypothetical protein
MLSYYRSGNVSKINTDIGTNTRISLRVLIKLFFAPVTAEVILMILIRTGEFCIIFINYHKTDWIGWHGFLVSLYVVSGVFP